MDRKIQVDILFGKENLIVCDNFSKRYLINISEKELNENNIQIIRLLYENCKELLKIPINKLYRIIIYLDKNKMKINSLEGEIEVDTINWKLNSMVFPFSNNKELIKILQEFIEVTFILDKIFNTNISEQVKEYIGKIEKLNKDYCIRKIYSNNNIFLMKSTNFYVETNDILEGTKFIDNIKRVPWNIEYILPVISTDMELIGFYDYVTINKFDLDDIYSLYSDLSIEEIEEVFNEVNKLCMSEEVKCDIETFVCIKDKTEKMLKNVKKIPNEILKNLI